MATHRLQMNGGELIWRESGRFALACSDLPVEEVERRALEHECGPLAVWRLAALWPDGERNPKPCETTPATHRHWYFEFR